MIEFEKNITMQKLRDFENLEEIQPSQEWNDSLMNQLNNRKRHQFAKFTIVILLIILVNIGFLINSINHRASQYVDRGKELSIISNEFLINTSSSKN
ncbi:MAG: hypothetical protein WCR42_00135 [bacterium]